MKTSLLMLLATCLLAASVWFFAQSSEMLSERDYLAGLIHIFVGFTTIRYGVELARLAVIHGMRS